MKQKRKLTMFELALIWMMFMIGFLLVIMIFVDVVTSTGDRLDKLIQLSPMILMMLCVWLGMRLTVKKFEK